MKSVEAKILAAIRAHTGLLWYEVGLLIYPGSAKARVNIFGKPFRELSGRGLGLTYDAIMTLQREGKIRADKAHRFTALVLLLLLTASPALAQIAVISSTYGANALAPVGNMTSAVASACNGLMACASPKPLLTIGDPVPGKSKDYSANWRCGSDPTIRTVSAPPEAGYTPLTLLCVTPPTPVPTPAPTQCASGQRCYQVRLNCVPSRLDCPAFTIYVRTLEGVSLTFQAVTVP